MMCEHLTHMLHITSLMLQIVGDGWSQSRMTDVVGGMGGDREISAIKLVLTLSTRFDG